MILYLYINSRFRLFSRSKLRNCCSWKKDSSQKNRKQVHIWFLIEWYFAAAKVWGDNRSNCRLPTFLRSITGGNRGSLPKKIAAKKLPPLTAIYRFTVETLYWSVVKAEKWADNAYSELLIEPTTKVAWLALMLSRIQEIMGKVWSLSGILLVREWKVVEGFIGPKDDVHFTEDRCYQVREYARGKRIVKGLHRIWLKSEIEDNDKVVQFVHISQWTYFSTRYCSNCSRIDLYNIQWWISEESIDVNN